MKKRKVQHILNFSSAYIKVFWEADILEIAVSIAPDGQGKFIGLFFVILPFRTF